MDEILRALNALAARADRLSQAFADELHGVLLDTERRLRLVIEQAATGSSSAVVKAARASRTKREIREALMAAGYDAMADVVTDAPFDALVSKVLAGRRAALQSAEMTASAAQKIESLKAINFSELLSEGDDLARALWQATVRGVFASRSVGAILADLGAVIDRTEPQIRTLYDLGISIFSRQVESLMAGSEPDTPYLYAGPLDGKTRPFCLARVGRVYTRAQIATMDNQQIDNVFLTGGGYNCRHQFLEVSKYGELGDYIGTQKRIPEVQDQLEALKEAA